LRFGGQAFMARSLLSEAYVIYRLKLRSRTYGRLWPKEDIALRHSGGDDENFVASRTRKARDELRIIRRSGLAFGLAFIAAVMSGRGPLV
jgi:hypothetical protein